MKPQRFLVRVTRKEFNALPIEPKRKALAVMADNLTIFSKRDEILNALDLLALALTEHNHKWTLKERRAYRRASRALAYK